MKLMVMPPIKDVKKALSDGADKEEGLRPTIVSAPSAASPELVSRPLRRVFTAKDKLRILAEADHAAGIPGGYLLTLPRVALQESARFFGAGAEI
jgi:hypothetical protein